MDPLGYDDTSTVDERTLAPTGIAFWQTNYSSRKIGLISKWFFTMFLLFVEDFNESRGISESVPPQKQTPFTGYVQTVVQH